MVDGSIIEDSFFFLGARDHCKQSFEGKENRAKHNRLQFIYQFGCLVAGGNFTVISTVISTVVFHRGFSPCVSP
jgi:hypothetical protein